MFRDNSLKMLRNIPLSEEFYIDFWLERDSWLDGKSTFATFTGGLDITFDQKRPKIYIKTKENDQSIGECSMVHSGRKVKFSSKIR